MVTFDVKLKDGSVKTYLCGNCTVQSVNNINFWTINLTKVAPFSHRFEQPLRKYLSNYMEYSHELKQINVLRYLGATIVSTTNVDWRTKEAKKLKNQLSHFSVLDLLQL